MSNINNKIEVVAGNIMADLDGSTIKEAIEYLAKFDESLILDEFWSGYEDCDLRIIRVETDEEKVDRLRKEKEERALLKRERERKRYLELKAKFEGE